MAKKRQKLTSEEAFESFYRDIYGDRWDFLKASMTDEKDTVLLSERLLSPYYMDPASIEVAEMLPIEDGNRVLDMCAAPGGKTLSLALRLGERGTLTSNDRSPQRVHRLRTVIEECLPREIAERITTTNHDASSWCLYEQEAYDRILLDAPCSSERHVMNDPKHLGIWSPTRPKRLSKEQYALLSSAFIALRHGGLILYSTCSINPGENSDVIARLFRKHPGEVEEIELEMNGEKQVHGTLILPDRNDGLGPMYCCLLRKI